MKKVEKKVSKDIIILETPIERDLRKLEEFKASIKFM